MITSTIALLLLLALASPIQIARSSNGTEHQETLVRINLVHVSRLTPVDHILGCQFASIDDPSSEDEACHVKRMNMWNYKTFNYIGEIQAGRPAKTFRVLLDSGSAYLWLLARNCSSIVGKTISATYDWTQSSSFENDGRQITVKYAGGLYASGRLARDKFQFGDLSVENLTFVQVDQTSFISQLEYYRVDGILGLSLENIYPRHYTDVESPVDFMMREIQRQSNGAIKQMLSLSLNLGSPDEQKAGELIFGGLDHSRYVGEITWASLTHSKQWRIRVDSIELSFLDADKQPIINELTVCQWGCDAIADTGTNVITGNPRDIRMINELIGAFHIGGGAYALPSCEGLDSRLPPLVVTISGTKFSLKPSQYTFQVDTVCYSGFKELDPKYPWILGSLFLGHFYAVIDYDNHRFGLAESPFESKASIK